jgi:hypothetical protein
MNYLEFAKAHSYTEGAEVFPRDYYDSNECVRTGSSKGGLAKRQEKARGQEGQTKQGVFGGIRAQMIKFASQSRAEFR